ncbi:hypothetical protein [Corynebacterium epidermidicanis]|uniref:Uncharacterized protein n=1 Tax=Corynebacterium epidermidicanis TaxID=1050174 RepID=A0A0G3GRS1_9CORY|nr:hypothetical protein [Corynebacterium epidermidicanis]AKK03819.1 hypothetical protein CEPID_09885 [Corynebacterium epidermidicanis]
MNAQEEFHLLARDSHPGQWWRPFAELAMLLAVFVLSLIVLMIGIDALTGEYSDQVGGAIAFISIVPAVLLAVRVAGRRPIPQPLWAPTIPSTRNRQLIISLQVSLATMSVFVLVTWQPLGTEVMDTPMWMLVGFLLVTPVMSFAEGAFVPCLAAAVLLVGGSSPA